ncbi:MAG: GNAT family N-acetyltransferase [Candidatus Heimdallarchaeota archaeon]|nr:GNAT family N-acetyltransferase [Candidatus Heimdallarchaeota archaeon]
MLVKKLIGNHCYLSPISLNHAELWAEWMNDLEVTIPLGDEAYTIITVENQRDLISEMIKNNVHVFSICDIETDTVIGRSMLLGVDLVNRTARFGIAIGNKEFWNKGYGQEATKLTLDYGFNLLNLHSIMLGTFSFNERAIKCYKNAGFKEIGRRRQARIIGDKKFDVVFMDILAEEFESSEVLKVLQEQEEN